MLENNTLRPLLVSVRFVQKVLLSYILYFKFKLSNQKTTFAPRETVFYGLPCLRNQIHAYVMQREILEYLTEDLPWDMYYLNFKARAGVLLLDIKDKNAARHAWKPRD